MKIAMMFCFYFCSWLVRSLATSMRVLLKWFHEWCTRSSSSSYVGSQYDCTSIYLNQLEESNCLFLLNRWLLIVFFLKLPALLLLLFLLIVRMHSVWTITQISQLKPCNRNSICRFNVCSVVRYWENMEIFCRCDGLAGEVSSNRSIKKIM